MEKIKPDLIEKDGFVWTDGKTYAKSVYLAPSANADDWRQIPESEKPIEPHADEYAQTEPEE